MSGGKLADERPCAADREKAATELIAANDAALRRTARRYSLCADDADDAYQRALEILLTKAPTTDSRHLIRWMHVVTKHEALAVRRYRERLVSSHPATDSDDGSDPIDRLPATSAGPDDYALGREHVARSSEALGALKPHEVRALILKAEGFSYAEICELTGWTYTKVNRCMAEGRKRFLEVYASIEEGRRCEELAPEVSAFCDGECSDDAAKLVCRHLRSCASCRAKVRHYRTVPARVLGLAPVALPAGRGLWHRVTEFVNAAHAKVGADGATAAQHAAAAGGSRGLGLAAMAKVLAICGATAAGSAACVAAGLAPPKFHLPAHERPARHAKPAESVHTTPSAETAASGSSDPAGDSSTADSNSAATASSASSYLPPQSQTEFSPVSGSSVSGGGSSGGSGTSSGGSASSGGGSEFGP
jgi:RNA polymerase sigma factor (sigma-70 family)